MAVTSTYTRTIIKSEFQANSFETGNQLAPDVTGLSNGGFAVAYNNGNISNGEVLVDFYDAAHERMGTFNVAYFGATDAVGQPQVTELANGNVLVTWVDAEAPLLNLRGHLFQSDGTPIGNEMNIDTVGGDIQVAALSGGGFVVTDARTENILHARFNDFGTETGVTTVVNNCARRRPERRFCRCPEHRRLRRHLYRHQPRQPDPSRPHIQRRRHDEGERLCC
ncbi:hypothetical protein [Mesorhizobium sp. CN2-181]|uniref:hypothetical protein n=1 Tax=Mesorhizobium yinganensis TaxID=3157707 RepID=UPI0032B7F889